MTTKKNLDAIFIIALDQGSLRSLIYVNYLKVILYRLTLFLVVIFLSGCNTTARFKVEDGLSMEPLENVLVNWTELHYSGW